MSDSFHRVASLSDVPDRGVFYLEYEDHPILLTRSGDSISALYGKCSHYNLPLKNAARHGDRLRCPFHHACFDATTGAQLEAPGLGGLARYATEIRQGEVYVELPNDDMTCHPIHARTEVDTEEHYVIVGGGVAAANAILGMRETGFTGKISLFSFEDAVPYDRTALSKSFLQKESEPENLALLPRAWYVDQGVELHLGTRVDRVDTNARTLTVEGGEIHSYNKILLATGGKLRSVSIPGATAENVFAIRHVGQSQALRRAARSATRAVVIGAGFIGLEAAMSLRELDCQVVVVAPDTVPFADQWGERVGRYVHALHEAAGVTFRLGHKVAKIVTETGRVSGVTLDNDQEISADLVVIGIGVEPAVDFVLGVPLAQDGSLVANENLRVAPNTYAAGDVVTYPDSRFGLLRIEHWKVAAQQGRVAGRNMAGADRPYQALPFFWSNQQGKNFRYAGHASDWDNTNIEGSLDEGDFIVRYYKDDCLIAVLGLGRDQEVARIAETEF